MTPDGRDSRGIEWILFSPGRGHMLRSLISTRVLLGKRLLRRRKTAAINKPSVIPMRIANHASVPAPLPGGAMIEDPTAKPKMSIVRLVLLILPFSNAKGISLS